MTKRRAKALAAADSQETDIVHVEDGHSSQVSVTTVYSQPQGPSSPTKKRKIDHEDQSVNSKVDGSSTTISTTTTVTLETSVSVIESNSPPSAQSKSVHPFFAKKSKDVMTIGGTPFTSIAPVKWSQEGSILVATYKQQIPSKRVASFDFDGTISNVKGSHVHPKGADDWKFFSTSIPDRFFMCQNQGYRVVIFSNQNGLNGGDARSNARKASFMGRIENVINATQKHCERAGVAAPSIIVFGATGDDWNRKPRPGMWDVFESKYNGGIVIDRNASFYVGDAAGRFAGHKPGVKKDFADTDHKFALNVGCKFYTPDAFFHFTTLAALEAANLPTKHHSHHAPIPPFDPKVFLENQAGKPLYTPTDTPLVAPPESQPEIIVFVGCPASGKSTFAKRHLVPHGYVQVNQDTLKTRDKCIKVAEESLLAGKSVIVDNTNPDPATRKLYFQLADKCARRLGKDKIPLRCFHFLADAQVCAHNNEFRTYMGNRDRDGNWIDPRGIPKPFSAASRKNDKSSSKDTSGQPQVHKLPGIAFNSFWARYQPPSETEGFDEIKRVEFVPEFDSEADRAKWAMYYV
ncbi:polynucleotide kinase 3 phosphatase-domain-containing protein [Fimicolochytrium jonesii]|uniref:polynucleotide kinase 3 phosphatase-domain-containing protein n=1 Tax=Fimicolochytrium jonesii TaxID=1396493 RepID=UPI0022FDE426|nr:polynucleotide kinase 3 phosphatase-domain-containing protein [Fimicolochytrium jonesii]KAI8819324.1 polynucleotide kinase 3 phosphatase-domain-containing protein [Fimicolochytrium jonesii]